MDWVRIESPAYWLMFTLAFLAAAQWESRHAERPWIVPAGRRWARHGALLFFNGVLLTIIVRLTPVAVAILAREHTWGVFRQAFFLDGVGYGVAFISTVLLLDLTRYAMHRLGHSFDWLWRIHRVHHSDPDFDVSTGARFHPLETILLQGANLAAIWLLSPPLAGVVASEVLAAGINFVEHANAAFPAAWERRLRLWIVTPSLHRIHHSEHIADQHTNLGTLFPWWDRILGTYTEKSTAGGEFAVGLPGYQNAESMGFGEILLQPVRPAKHSPQQPAEMENAGSAIEGEPASRL